MLEVGEAQSIVLSATKRLRPEVTALTSSALEMVTAEDVLADTDSPPFAKSMMDGYAVRAMDCVEPCELEVIEEIAAGSLPLKAVHQGQCARIFTGAPLPEGADAVVMVEKTDLLPNGRVAIREAGFPPGKHVFPQGAEWKEGDIVVPSGTMITPISFGLFASCGRTAVACTPNPRISIICTGNEIVEANMKPKGPQIRNSNGPMLVAQSVRAGALPRYLGIAKDTEKMLAALMREGLGNSNIMILAGGVSAGSLDLVPGTLEGLGVTIHFHKVRMKPGKPLLFGTHGDTLVFGLPGNPVSAFVGFELFVRPALRAMMGRSGESDKFISGTLTNDFKTKNDRPTYHPATSSSQGVSATQWAGSADLRSLLTANALLVLPAGDVSYKAGQSVSMIPIK